MSNYEDGKSKKRDENSESPSESSSEYESGSDSSSEHGKKKELKTAKEVVDETVEDSQDDSESDSDSDSDSDDESSDSTGEIKVDNNFKEKVIKWIEFDDLIRQKEKECKELKKSRKELEDYVLKFLNDNDINVIEIEGGKLRRNKSETKTSLTNDNIKSAIKKKFGDEKTVEEIMKMMEELRPMKTHVNLKRTFERGPRGGNK